MNEDGYTLTEMLAALLMIGLAVGGLAQGVRLIGSAQAASSERLRDTRALRAAEGNLSALLSRAGPSGSPAGVFTGDADSLAFACQDGATCSAALAVAEQGARLVVDDGRGERAFVIPIARAHFVYQGDALAAAWPPEGPKQTLRAVHLLGAHEEPVFTSRIWKEQPAECAFDSISRDCREAAS